MAPRIYTASWSTLHTAIRVGGVLPVQPVRISRGLPRFWPEAERFPAISELFPPGWVFAVAKTDPERADRGYRRGLHVLGVDRVRALLESSRVDDRPLALCCFESGRYGSIPTKWNGDRRPSFTARGRYIRAAT